jgi:hypothetical protein
MLQVKSIMRNRKTTSTTSSSNEQILQAHIHPRDNFNAKGGMRKEM